MVKDTFQYKGWLQSDFWYKRMFAVLGYMLQFYLLFLCALVFISLIISLIYSLFV